MLKEIKRKEGKKAQNCAVCEGLSNGQYQDKKPGAIQCNCLHLLDIS